MYGRAHVGSAAAVHVPTSGQRRHAVALEAAQAAPQLHLVVLQPLQQDLQVPAADVVADNHVGVDALPPCQQVRQECPLRHLRRHRISAVLTAAPRVLCLHAFKTEMTTRAGHRIVSALSRLITQHCTSDLATAIEIQQPNTCSPLSGHTDSSETLAW